jgi:hypothetical protein
MRNRYVVALVTFALVLFSCNKDKTPPVITPPPPPPPAVLLKDIVILNLPSPYYGFEYNAAGKPIKTSFSAGVRSYDVLYAGTRINELKSIHGDRLVYIYNETGQVDIIKYIKRDGAVYKVCYLTYNGQQLLRMEWERKQPAGFIMDRTLSFIYQPDGNLLEMTDHRHLINGEQPEASYTDRFEQYDTKINTDGFSLLHDGSDHLLLVPGIQLQKNNAGKLIRTGTGIDYTINYTYTYNDKNAPLTKLGDGVFTSGPNNGQRFQTNAAFTYY